MKLIETIKSWLVKTPKIRPPKDIEDEINQKLFLICGGMTVLVMLMKVIEFFSRGKFSPADISFLYIGTLVIYSMHKEVIRWLGKRKQERQGEYFVYGWIGLTALLYLINFFSQNYFITSPQKGPLNTLRELSIISLEVLAIFIITRCIKVLKMKMEEKKEGL